MPNSLQSAFVNPLDASSCAACLLGPKALMPARARSSTSPAASGVSGPTTTRSTALRLQKSITAAWSAMSSATHSASRAMPALPGAHHSFVTSGEAAIFHAKACSRPPEPSRRMFMGCSQMRVFEAVSVARNSVPPQGGIAVIPDGMRAPGMTLRLPGRSRDDFLQRRHMPGERAASRRRGGHRGLRLLADKGLVDRDIAGLRKRFDMGAEIAVGGAGQLFQPGEFEAYGSRQRMKRRHDFQPHRLVDDVVELGHRLAPTHPQPAEDQPAAVDHRHPQRERLADVVITDQRQHGDTGTNRDEGVTDPEACDRIEQHEINRPERSLLARRKMAEHVRAEISESKEQQERHQHPDVKGTHAHPGIGENADRKQTGDAGNIDGDPDVTAIAWPEPGRDIACEHKHAPQDHDQAVEIVDPRLPDALNDVVDLGQRFRGLLAADHDCPIPRVATSSATADTAFGTLTMPM